MSRNQTTPMVATIILNYFLYPFCDCCLIALGFVAVAIADYLCHIKKKKKKTQNQLAIIGIF